MGFIDYAWSVSLQKDDTKVKIKQNAQLNQPTLKADDYGFTIELPPAIFVGDEQIIFAKQKFGSDSAERAKLARLFRASVMHLSAHTLAPFSKDRVAPKEGDSIPEAFIKRLVNDAYVDAYMRFEVPEKVADTAYANALAYHKIKPTTRIFNPATKLMSALLTKQSAGSTKGTLDAEQEDVLNQISSELAGLKKLFLDAMAKDDKTMDADKIFDEKVKLLAPLLEPFGPFLEAPSLSHTESIGNCSIYSEADMPQEELDAAFKQSLAFLGGTLPQEGMEELWGPQQEAEALQAFNSDQYQKQREEKILGKLTPYIEATRFKSVSFPEEDYTQYLRARNLVQGASRRLLEILRSAFNYLDEDPRQEMGQLDLAAVIQSLASNKPATDVFTLDEYLKPSFAWSIVFDVSSSMQVKGEYGRALAIAVAEAAKELMQDATSWTFFAFSNDFFILKDSTESYSKRVRARIGGLRFEGLTFIPDAVQVAGKMLAKRFEEQRVLIVISDGWPYGYPEMPETLKKQVDSLLLKGVIVLGIGVETDRMGKYFRLHSSVYCQKDLVNKFGAMYADASAKALET